MSRDDLDAFELEAMEAFAGLSEKYYLDPVRPRARQRGSKLVVEFDHGREGRLTICHLTSQKL